MLKLKCGKNAVAALTPMYRRGRIMTFMYVTTHFLDIVECIFFILMLLRHSLLSCYAQLDCMSSVVSNFDNADQLNG